MIMGILVSLIFLILLTGFWMNIANKMGQAVGLGEFIMRLFNKK